jgi:hypothetical protein
MEDKLEITLRITLDRSSLERRLRQPVANEKAFFVLGLVNAQLTSTFGNDCCHVEMDAATGIRPALIQDMNSFARRHKQAVDALDQRGEAVVQDSDVLEILQMMHNVIITPIGSQWRVIRTGGSVESYPGEPHKAN